MAAKAIYLDINDEVTSALQKIQRAGTDEILVVIPQNARISRTLNNLKLLRAQCFKLEKELSLASSDKRTVLLAQRAGIKVSEKLPDSSQIPTAVRRMARGRSGMGDIILPKKRKAEVEEPVEEQETPEVATEEEEVSGEESQKKEDQISELFSSDADRVINVPRKVSVPFRYYRAIVVPIVAVLTVTAILVFLVLPSASVTVDPRVEPITRDLEILVDSQAEHVDVQNLIVPGTIVTEEKADSQSFDSTGSKPTGKQAQGQVYFYNFSTNSLILRKETTRLEANGNTYYLQQDAGGIRPTARIGQGEDEQIDETTLTGPIPIIAEVPGTEYNLPAGTRFEVYNEVFGHQPEYLYAQSKDSVAGGTDESVKVVSEEDIVKAREELGKLILAKLTDDLRRRLESDVSLADNASTIGVLEEALTHKAGDETDKFQLTQSVRIRALVYRSEDVGVLVKERIIRLLPDNKELMSSSKDKLQSEFVSLDLEAGAGTLKAHFESSLLYKIDSGFLARGLSGKTETEVKEILLSRPEIQRVEVHLSPFWVKKVPNFAGKVKLEVNQPTIN